MNDRILPFLALFSAIVIFFAYINPTWTGEIAATRAAIAVDKEAIATAQQYAAQQDKLTAAHDAINPNDIALLTTFLPDSADNVGVILDLNALAARSGIALSNITMNPNGDSAAATEGDTSMTGTLLSSNTNPVSSVDMSLSAVGTFSALQEFLTGIEKSARLLDVRSLSVTNSNTGVYTYKIVLRLFWLQ
jgi:hypothetical protein